MSLFRSIFVFKYHQRVRNARGNFPEVRRAAKIPRPKLFNRLQAIGRD
jgi:hypothetical protein